MKELLEKINLDTIDDFKFRSTIGEGKASACCLYENIQGKKVVVKMLIAPRNQDELSRFKEEVSTLEQATNEPSLAFTPRLILGLVHYKPYPIYYYVMEYLEGTTLFQFISDNPLPWSWELAVEMLARIASALGFTTLGVFVHRDLHPGNIIITGTFDFDEREGIYLDPGIRIMDFGCNKNVLKDLFGLWYEDKFRHIGAISTWSPEFINNPQAVTTKHDSWALGVLLYRLLTAKYPIHADCFGELIAKYNIREIDWERIDRLKIPVAVKILSRVLLDFDPEKRYGAGEIARICSAILHTDLLERDDNIVKIYMRQNGNLYYCARCLGIVGNQTKCPKCGTILDDENCLPFLHGKKRQE